MESKTFLVVLNDWLWFARSEYFGVAIATILVGWAIISSVKMYWASNRAKSETKKILSAIDPYSTPSEITENFSLVDEKIQNEKRFKNTWIEFAKTLIPPLDHIDSPEFRSYRATKRPGDYFDSDHVLKDVRPLFLESENLIAVGLIFTFLGLIAALLHAGINLTAANADGVQRVIQDLLSTAGAKFFASLGGVFGALIQTVFKRSFSDKAEAELDKFITKLESLLPFASLEKIAAEQYAHAIRQTTRLEEMGTEITLAIGSRIENALNGMPDLMKNAMTFALTPTNDRLEKLADGISTSSTDAMAELVDKFKKELTGAGEQTMNQVVSQLDSLSTTLNQTVGSLATSNVEIRQTMTAILEAFKTSGSQFGDSVKTSADAATSQIAEVTKSMMDALTGVMQKLDQQHQDTTAALTNLVETFNQAGTEAAEKLKLSSQQGANEISQAFQGTIQTVLDNASKANESIAKNIAEGVSTAGAEMSKQAKEALQDTTDTISNAMEKVSVALEEWRQSTLQATGAMSQVNTTLNAHRAGIEKVNSNLTETEVAISATAETLREATGPLSVATTQMSSSTEALRKAVLEAMTRLGELGGVTSQSAADIAKSIEGLVAAWEKQSVHLGRTDEQIEKAFMAVVQNLEQSLGVLHKFSQSLNDSLGSSIRDLGTIAAELVDAVEGIKK